MENQKLYLYPIWLRVWHGVNAIGIVLLIITGLSMQYGNINYPLIPFKLAVLLHNFSGVIVSVSYLFFIVLNFISDNGIHYRFKIRGLFERFYKQMKFYVSGYFKNENPPFPITEQNKFNPLQRVSYAIAMYFFMSLVVVTGIALLFPEAIFERIFAYSGVQLTSIIHAIAGFFISFFLLIHLYVASIGKHPLKNYKSIINGYHHSD